MFMTQGFQSVEDLIKDNYIYQFLLPQFENNNVWVIHDKSNKFVGQFQNRFVTWIIL